MRELNKLVEADLIPEAIGELMEVFLKFNLSPRESVAYIAHIVGRLSEPNNGDTQAALIERLKTTFELNLEHGMRQAEVDEGRAGNA